MKTIIKVRNQKYVVMKHKLKFALTFLLITMILSCSDKHHNTDQGNKKSNSDGLWLSYTKKSTIFKLWSPQADKVKIYLYEAGNGGEAYATYLLEPADGRTIWQKQINGDLQGVYYTYQVKFDGKWLDETPGIYAKAVGVNGKRAMVLDLQATNPEGWEKDKGPTLTYPNEAIIYELHIRDMTIHPASGSSMPGSYLGLVESGTKGPEGISTGIDHLKELGINYVLSDTM